MADDERRKGLLSVAGSRDTVRTGEVALRRGEGALGRGDGGGGCDCGAVARRLPHLESCPEYRELHVRPGPRGDFDLIMKHVVRGNPLYVELKNGSRFVGVVVDYSDRLLELDVGLLSFADIAFVSATSIPHIGLVGR